MKGKTKKIIATLGIGIIMIGSIFSFAGCGKDSKEDNINYDKFVIIKRDSGAVLHRASFKSLFSKDSNTQCGLETSGYSDGYNGTGKNSTFVIESENVSYISNNIELIKIKNKENIPHDENYKLCDECFPEGVIE